MAVLAAATATGDNDRQQRKHRQKKRQRNMLSHSLHLEIISRDRSPEHFKPASTSYSDRNGPGAWREPSPNGKKVPAKSPTKHPLYDKRTDKIK
ncbi:MAG TPA: hypothetical protein DEB39_00075 [Planctomycetaceae bacterium]|nr:hypothetical protein [Planctomycetaceae bacterium]